MSLDGPEYIHDKLRGRGTYRKTVSFIEYLKNIKYKNFEVAATYTRKNQKLGITKKDMFDFFYELNTPFNINNVFTKNKVLLVKDAENSIEKRKEFIDKSIEIVIENEYSKYISPILYDVLISMIYKSTNYTFCDDISPKKSVTFDVDGTQKSCFRFWGTHDFNDKAIEINNKDGFKECNECWCRGMCMECVANIIEGYSSIIDENGKFLKCDKQNLMEYCVQRILELSLNHDRLYKLVNNFDNFIRYA